MTDPQDVLAALILEDGEPWGRVATADQRADARAILDPESPPFTFLTRSRGYSKTTDLAGIAVAAMATQLPPASRAYALAADRDQGRLLVDAVEGFVRRTPLIRDSFDVQSWRVLYIPTGSTLDVLAADAAGAWGLKPALTIVDEIAQWASTPQPRRLWEAVSSGAAKIPGARMVVLTTAGDPSHWSRRILDHALSDPLWHVHEVAGPAPWIDHDKLEEQRRRLPESSFRRLFLNQWVEAEDRLTTAEDLAACIVLDGPIDPVPSKRYVIGVDIGLKRDRTVAAVCHAERVDGKTRVLLDRMAVWAGTRESPVRLDAIEAWLRQAWRSFNRATIVMDPWQAVGLAQRLRSTGVRVDEFAFSSQSVGRLAVTLHTSIRNHALALPDDPDLIDELSNVRLRETSPGVLRMDHDADQHDDQAIGLALAVHHLIGRDRGSVDVASLGRGLATSQRQFVRASSHRIDQPGRPDYSSRDWARYH
jgi:phage terminase large subunit-like protein